MAGGDGTPGRLMVPASGSYNWDKIPILPLRQGSQLMEILMTTQFDFSNPHMVGAAFLGRIADQLGANDHMIIDRYSVEDNYLTMYDEQFVFPTLKRRKPETEAVAEVAPPDSATVTVTLNRVFEAEITDASDPEIAAKRFVQMIYEDMDPTRQFIVSSRPLPETAGSIVMNHHGTGIHVRCWRSDPVRVEVLFGCAPCR